MKFFLKRYKRGIRALTVLFIFIFCIYFSVTQPIILGYKFDESLLQDVVSVDEHTLERHVKFLSQNDRTSEVGQAEIVRYIVDELKINNINDEDIEKQTYTVEDREYVNIIVHFREKQDYTDLEYVIGGHYDAFGKLPGADDNASAIAGLLEISRVLKSYEGSLQRNIDLVFYSTEEPPFFSTENMGSYIHADSVHENNTIKLVVILEMIGYFSEEEKTQNYPVNFLKFFYPDEGNFITIVSNFSNSFEVRDVKKKFKSFLKTRDLITVESMNAFESIPGIGFSDHRNYWLFDIPAVMITDTAFYRNKNYHTKDDTYEKLDYVKMKEVVDATVVTVLSF